MRKLASVLAASILVIAACSGSGATQQPAGTGGGGPTAATSQGGGGDCSYWCGTGSAQVTMGGATVTISPGGCYDGGKNGVDIRFGDFTKSGTAAAKDYVVALVYHGGNGTPIVSGGVNGELFVLSTSGATGTIGDDGKGSFSGTNMFGGTITATFSCK